MSLTTLKQSIHKVGKKIALTLVIQRQQPPAYCLPPVPPRPGAIALYFFRCYFQTEASMYMLSFLLLINFGQSLLARRGREDLAGGWD